MTWADMTWQMRWMSPLFVGAEFADLFSDGRKPSWHIHVVVLAVEQFDGSVLKSLRQRSVRLVKELKSGLAYESRNTGEFNNEIDIAIGMILNMKASVITPDEFWKIFLDVDNRKQARNVKQAKIWKTWKQLWLHPKRACDTYGCCNETVLITMCTDRILSEWKPHVSGEIWCWRREECDRNNLWNTTDAQVTNCFGR